MRISNFRWTRALGLLLLHCVAPAFAQAPSLVNVTPANGATGVSTNSILVFVFDQDMDTLGVVPIASFPPALIGNFEVKVPNVFFTGTWGQDKRTLTVTSSTPLPADTLVEWTLNPPGGTLFAPLANVANTPLATVSGSFRTAAPPVLGPPPKLISVTPAVGATDVSPTSPVTFVFDLEMNTNVTLSASFPPFLIGNYEFTPATVAMSSGSWSADKRTLTFAPISLIFQNTTVGWTLNPAGTTAPLISSVGTPLAATNGTFRIAGSSANTNETCNGTNVTAAFYSINKHFGHTQIAADQVVPTGDAPAAFHAFSSPEPIDTNGVGRVLAASFTPPGQRRATTLSNLFGIGYFFSATPTTEPILEASYPPGAYQMSITMGEGTTGTVHNVTMNMPSPPAGIPTLLNFAEAQAINPGQEFTLRWNSLTPQLPSAFISVIIVDLFGNLVFQAPNYCVPRSLAPTDTSVVIPANYFKAGFTYTATLQFGYNFYQATNEVPRLAGFGSVSRATTIEIKAAGGGGNPGSILAARFLTSRILPNGHPEMTLSGSAGQPYLILRSGSLSGINWPQIGTVTMNSAGTATYEDPTPTLAFPVFYQAVGNLLGASH